MRVVDRVGSAVGAARDWWYGGVSWQEALAASSPPLTIADFYRVVGAVPTGECAVEEQRPGHGWPGDLRVLVRGGQHVGYVHLVPRTQKRSVAHDVAVGVDVALLGMTFLKDGFLRGMTQLTVGGFASDRDPWYDVALHDGSGRLLLWARGVDAKDRTVIEVLLPDGTVVARVRRDRSARLARVEGLGPLSGAGLTTTKNRIGWGESTGERQHPETWEAADGTPAMLLFRREHNQFSIDIADGSAKLLAACGALWWWTHVTTTY